MSKGAQLDETELRKLTGAQVVDSSIHPHLSLLSRRIITYRLLLLTVRLFRTYE